MVTDPTPGPTASTRALPQAVLTPLTGSAIFLVVRIEPGGEQAARDLLERVAGLTRAVGFRVPAGNLSCVTSIGSDAWDRLFSGPRPAALHPFIELEGAKHKAVSTPGDLLFHIRAGQLDLCFELAQQIMKRLGTAPRPWSTRSTASSTSRCATCSASSTAPRTRPGRGCRSGLDRRRGSGVRRRQLRDRAEVPARHDGLERADRSSSRSG